MKKLKMPKKLKITFLIISTFLAVISVLYIYIKLEMPYDKPDQEKKINPPFGSIVLISNEKTFTGEQECFGGNISVRWAFVENYSSLSSILLDNNELNIKPDDKIVDRLLYQKGSKKDNLKDPYFDNIYEWLKKRCKKINSQYLFYFGDDPYDVNLIKLVYEHFDVIRKLCPTEDEFKNLPENEQNLIKHWFINYIGQWICKIRITVDNTRGDNNFNIYSLIYDVKSTNQFKGIMNSPSFPIFNFEIKWTTGRQEFFFNSKNYGELTVNKGESITFDVNLKSSTDCPQGPSWQGEINLGTSVGDILVGDFNLATYNSFLN
jgi:hypothetical protein